MRIFVKRLTKIIDSMLTLLYYQNMPADNNGSERAIRNVNVKNNVPGHFRTEMNATHFAILRSIIDTINKNSQNAF